MKVFCVICKQHVALPDEWTAAEALERFRACGHDDRKVPQLRHGQVGAYMVDFETERTHETVALGADAPAAPREVAECFENAKPIDPERVAA